ncbi:MAG TPA: biotin--protein ligase [Desulfonatronum sp.]|nr:biotin--protein ligase [Desulfonatronum sp.]
MSSDEQRNPGRDHVYVLWDESYYWALLLWRFLRRGLVPFRLVRARDIANGLLERFPPAALLVPGGWARFKSAALGPRGRRAIGKYLEKGGSYLGFCGGAGLALPEYDGLALCPLCRKPMSQRLPNFSGSVAATLHAHPLVPENLASPVHLPVWWPSQFALPPDANVQVLASYAGPGPGFWVSDLAWDDIRNQEPESWRQLYGINLDPDQLAGEPCVIAGVCGQGRYILSYAHLESPAFPAANFWLGHMLSLLLGQPPGILSSSNDPWTASDWDLQNMAACWNDPRLARMTEDLEEVIALGKRHFLLFWRYPWLLGWRRGVPGFVLTTLFAQLKTVRCLEPGKEALQYWDSRAADAADAMAAFREQMSAYLTAERLALHNGPPSSPEACSSEVQQIRRNALVGEFPGYGGLFGHIAKTLDELLWLLCR